MEMKLYKALKEKNILAGEIRKLEILIQQKNSYDDGAVRKYNIEEKVEELSNKRSDLVRLKTAITLANTGIVSKIYELAELKAEHKFWSNLSTREGVVKDYNGNATTYNVVYDEIDVETTLLGIQTKIDLIQDELDQYNHTKSIDY